MCNPACLEFARHTLTPADVAGKAVIEVGSMDVNGSVRSLVEDRRPGSYLGVDLELGPGNDELCDAVDLVTRHGPNRFDLVISTAALEHVEDWRRVVRNPRGCFAEAESS